MARIDWAVACELAFLDRQDRLCVIGVLRRLPVPNLPIQLGQLMLVARVVDLRPVEELEVAIGVMTPGGVWTTPADSDGMVIEMAGEYMLATLRGFPVMEEGNYNFQISLRGQAVVSVNIPVLTVGRSVAADVH